MRTRLSFALVGLLLLAAAQPALAAKVTFTYQDAGPGPVFVAGEFNSWSDSANPMANTDGVWTLVLDLDPGTYQYKFVAGGSWLADPGNPNTAEDGFGGENSVVTVADGVDEMAAGSGAVAVAAAPVAAATGGEVAVTFSLEASSAAGVYLAGEFNSWSDSADPLTNTDGVWSLVMNLAPGTYQYKFVVDGSWQADPGNPNATDDGFGGQNSELRVPAGQTAINAAAGTGAVAAAGPGAAAAGGDGAMRSVEFRYTPVISGVGAVYLAGSFNDWNDSKTPMLDADNDGTYTATLLLAQGTYQYKFVVDGNWKADPNNANTSEDGFGGQNSVLTVDTSFSTIEIELGDGKIYSDDLEPVFDYSTCNPLSPTEISITARAHLGDVESVALMYSLNGEKAEMPLPAVEKDASFQYYRGTVTMAEPGQRLDYLVRYQDAQTVAYFGATGMGESVEAAPFQYRAEAFPPFFTPEWAKEGVIYQIFPERFANGDKSNDPDFTEEMYQGANTLPSSGKTNGEYFHLVDDWYDVGGLVRSPYRTDGKPDYYSFYGGDIAGIKDKLDYLNDLGITVIYFNPLNAGMSNHKYDPIDYLLLDPHFGGEDEFKDFVKAAHDKGIKIVVDVAFNHTGNWHFAFRDAVKNGPASEYYKWYEFHRWPLPEGRDFNASDYYDCWWGFGLHPNLNFDLTRSNADENNIGDISDANPNMPVVEYCLSVADKWLGEYDIDGFRLDVPNEVPFWFWKLFRERCNQVKPDVWLVGEIWGNAGRWIGPECFDSTMNYKFFRDPVMDFFGKGTIDATAFDARLSPGRFQYPPQSVAVMMNLMDSHDTIRFLTSAGRIESLMLGAMFSMTYVGMPHVWYGNEVGMSGGKDPDCRRPMDWRYEGDPRRQALRDYYGKIGRLRRDSEVLQHGQFVTLSTSGKCYAFARILEDKVAVVMLNAGSVPVTLEVDEATLETVRSMLSADADRRASVIVGRDSFPRAQGGLVAGQSVNLGAPTLQLTVPANSGAILMN